MEEGRPSSTAMAAAMVQAARVKELGFRQVWNLGPQEANTRYFAGRTDGLCALSLFNLMKAQVGHVS